MSSAAIAVIIVLAFLAYLAFAATSRQFSEILAQLGELREEVQKNRSELDRHLDLLLTIRHQTESDYDRALREWDGMVDLTADEVRTWKPGNIVSLVSKSYMYPSEKAATYRFEFKFEAITPTARPEQGFEVTGVEREHGVQPWTKFRFYVNQTEATTSTFEGTIRRRKKPADFGV